MDTRLTIISVYYSRAQYDRYLGSSLEKQSFCDYQLLLVDNSEGIYQNMKAAVDSVRDRVAGEFVMLVHPDIRLPETDTLARIVADCERGFPKYAILGGIGSDGPIDAPKQFSSVIHECGKRPGAKPDQISDCAVLDECIVVMPKEIFDAYPLADLGKTWHMYIVELCCRLKSEGKRIGVFVPETVHASWGTLNRSYYRTMWRVAGMYRRKMPYVYSTCGTFPTALIPLIKTCLNAAYGWTMPRMKAFMMKYIPGSKYLFRLTAVVFAKRRERVRLERERAWTAQAESWQRAKERQKEE